MLAMICPDSCDVRTALRSSPAIPRIRIIRDSLASLCLRWSVPGSDVNSAINSPMQPTPTTVVEIYPNHSQQPSVVFNNATSESGRIIADHMKRQARSWQATSLRICVVIECSFIPHMMFDGPSRNQA
jgi:hypothetical protein